MKGEIPRHRLRKNQPPTVADLLREARRLFVYDDRRGGLVWKVNRGKAKAGDLAGGLPTDGYPSVRLLGGRYKAHHVVWLLAKGRWPKTILDHKDRDKTNCRIGNLREVSARGNFLNSARMDGRGAGRIGAVFSNGSWLSRISINGKRVYLGRFPTEAEASEAYLKAAKRVSIGMPPI